MRHRRRPWARILLALIPLALVLGIWLGGHPDWLPGFARNALVADSDGRLYEQALDTIERDYYRKVDRDKLLNTSLAAAVESLQDQFSHYFSPEGRTRSSSSTPRAGSRASACPCSRSRTGLRVEEVYDDSPAKEGGLKVGDIIVFVNGKSLAGKTSDQSTALIKGPAGSHGDARAQGRAQAHDRSAPRSTSRSCRPRSKRVGRQEDRVGAARRASPQARATTSRRRSRSSSRQGAKGVVLDLRHNGGGLLNEAVTVASVFLEDGRVVSTKGRARPERVYNAEGGAIARKIPVVVLVDEGSASASEIVTGALQDRKRAKVVGTRTFGKGVFQEIERLPNGGALDITVGEYFTPTGRNLGGGGVRKGAGITPDIKASDDPKTGQGRGAGQGAGDGGRSG